jgi:predicted metal-binding membrane protein
VDDGGLGSLGFFVPVWIAMMATLFALRVMSIAWIAVIAGLIAVEKLLPWARIATLGVAAALGCLAASVALGAV